jgi:hypothetical protein
MWPPETVNEALTLLDGGLNDCEVARRIQVPRSTVRGWCVERDAAQVRIGNVAKSPRDNCGVEHEFSVLPGRAYAYLLGMYLGDGCISAAPRGVWKLRITLDSKYPRIVAECQAAMKEVLPANKPGVCRSAQGRWTEVYAYSKHWPCLIPQHGPGRKHMRQIHLRPWQKNIVARNRRSFLRGLIHSDGTRIIATERKGDYVRRAPRYAFSNLSADIRSLFCESCDALGIPWTQPSERQIAIYRLNAVAELDTFVGPKR